MDKRKIQKGYKAVNVRIPEGLHTFLRKLTISSGLSATEIIRQYLEYLRKESYRNRVLLNADSKEGFKLEVKE
jgi:hypothetical protein